MKASDIHKQVKALTNSKKLCVAYSGGLDSHVLLHALSNYDAQVRAIHINHNLSANADLWAKHCQKTCENLNIPLAIQKINLEGLEGSLEAIAREQRYLALSNRLDGDETLITAQHQDDQAETFLIQLLRGSGPKGLASMPAKKTFSNTFLIRPLLHFTRSEIESYASEHDLNWIEDESNQDLKFDRNFIRHELIPFIEKRWPSAQNTLSRSARHFANMQQVIDELTEKALKEILIEKNMISIEKLLTYPLEEQKNLIRQWIYQASHPLPSEKKLSSILETVLHAREDAAPLVTWAKTEIRRYQNKLYVLEKKPSPDLKDFQWHIEKDETPPHSLPGCKNKQDLIAAGINIEGVKTITIAFRRNGKKCKLKGHSQSKSLKKLFQEWGIPPWERENVPLLYDGGILLGAWNSKNH